MKNCKIESCNTSGRITRGLCNKHYLRWLRHGDTSRGRILPTAETIRKRGEANKRHYAAHPERAKRHSDFMKANLHAGNFKKGYTPWSKGRKLPERQGENNSNWRGGVTSEEKLERVKFQQTIQQLVFQRDDYTCHICEQRGGFLQADHIKSWKDYPELRFNLDNCRTLCMACHYYVTFKRKMPKGTVWGHTLSRRVAP